MNIVEIKYTRRFSGDRPEVSQWIHRYEHEEVAALVTADEGESLTLECLNKMRKEVNDILNSHPDPTEQPGYYADREPKNLNKLFPAPTEEHMKIIVWIGKKATAKDLLDAVDVLLDKKPWANEDERIAVFDKIHSVANALHDSGKFGEGTLKKIIQKNLEAIATTSP